MMRRSNYIGSGKKYLIAMLLLLLLHLLGLEGARGGWGSGGGGAAPVAAGARVGDADGADALQGGGGIVLTAAHVAGPVARLQLLATSNAYIKKNHIKLASDFHILRNLFRNIFSASFIF
jgi:hypothetical protein